VQACPPEKQQPEAAAINAALRVVAESIPGMRVDEDCAAAIPVGLGR
jgi:hypothetical protein